MAEIRCKHASGQRVSAMDFMRLAMEFYEENCVGCSFRTPTGRLPTVVSEVEERRRQIAARDQQEREELALRHASWQQRKTERDRAIATEGYPVRDLAGYIDVVDPEPTVELTADETGIGTARRRIEETARLAPALFNEALVETIVALATASYDGMAQTVLRLLGNAGVVSKKRAAQIAAQTLRVFPIREAGQTVAEFAKELSPLEVANASNGAIMLASDNDEAIGSLRRIPAEPVALLALAAVNLDTVMDAVLRILNHDSDHARAQAGHAARHLLLADASRVATLGEPLALSIRGKDQGYAGTPSPARAAVRALAEAWRCEPDVTCSIVERSADHLHEEARAELVSIVHCLAPYKGRPNDPARRAARRRRIFNRTT